jgi:hypothetical protein
MPHRPRPSLTRLLTQAVLTTLAVTTGGGLLVMGSAGVADAPDRGAPTRSAPVSEPVATPESRLIKRYDCSTDGFGPDAQPRSALVRDQRGKVRVVSFDQGWAIHTSGRDDVTLVAFCLRSR